MGVESQVVSHTHTERLARLAADLHVMFEGDLDAKVTIVFLHGIASNSGNWKKMSRHLRHVSARQIYVDLLGFGDSPKPWHADYSVDTHAKAVWMSLDSQHVHGPVIVVGHSMGCIVATHMATIRPDQVMQLVLVSLPLYRGYEILQKDSVSHIDRFINQLYFKAYTYIREDSLLLSFGGGMVSRLIGGRSGFELGWRNVIAFRRSLLNCIEFQHTELELRTMRELPVYLYYGRFDIFVIKQYLQNLAHSRPHTHIHRVRAGHIVSESLARAVSRDLAVLVKEGSDS